MTKRDLTMVLAGALGTYLAVLGVILYDKAQYKYQLNQCFSNGPRIEKIVKVEPNLVYVTRGIVLDDGGSRVSPPRRTAQEEIDREMIQVPCRRYMDFVTMPKERNSLSNQ